MQTGNFYTPDVCIDPNYDGLSINCEQYIDNNNNGDFDPTPNNGTDLFDECLDVDYDGTSLECSDYIDNNGNNIFDTSNDESVSMKLIKLDHL